MTYTLSETRNLPAGLGLTGEPIRPRRTPRAWFDRFVTRLQVRYALWSVRADLATVPTFVLADIGIASDDVDEAIRRASLLIIRRAIRVKLDRARGGKGGRRWTP